MDNSSTTQPPFKNVGIDWPYLEQPNNFSKMPWIFCVYIK